MKIIPDKLKEASYLGIAFTVLFLGMIGIMVMN